MHVYGIAAKTSRWQVSVTSSPHATSKPCCVNVNECALPAAAEPEEPAGAETLPDPERHFRDVPLLPTRAVPSAEDLDVNPLRGDRDHDAFAPWVLSSSERAVFDSSLLRMSQKGPVVPQRRKTMAYQAEISRKNPGCFLFLVDQSESMEDPFGGGEAGRRKAEELATILNKLIHNLCIRCSKSDSIYDYFHVGVLGYSEDSCKPALGGELSGRSLVPISELANKPLRIEDRVKKSDDGAGGVMDQTVKFPVWFDPYSKGGTPMCAALKEATTITQTWCQEHPTGFPPIVINITDGEATDGDLVAEARKLAAVSGEDGSVLLFNIHLSSTAGPSIELPGNGNKLPDQHAKQLFEASSTLTPFMVARATELRMPAEENSRGFIFNAQPLHVIHFLDIGTRPANVHLR